MSYDKFERSTTPSTFNNYSYDDATIAWIDILGVRSLTHAKISETMRKVLDLAAEATSTGPIFETKDAGLLVGTPNSAAQYAVIGDTIVMIEQHQPKTRAAAKLALFYRAGIFSKKLFENQLLHRGVIVEGPADCFQMDHNPVITGAGVVGAYSLESKINCTGIFIHESCDRFLNERASQLQHQNTYIPLAKLTDFDSGKIAPNTKHVMYNLAEGYHLWNRALDKGTPHEKVANSKVLTEQIVRFRNGVP